jgi:hypothetical protein
MVAFTRGVHYISFWDTGVSPWAVTCLIRIPKFAGDLDRYKNSCDRDAFIEEVYLCSSSRDIYNYQ